MRATIFRWVLYAILAISAVTIAYEMYEEESFRSAESDPFTRELRRGDYAQARQAACLCFTVAAAGLAVSGQHVKDA